MPANGTISDADFASRADALQVGVHQPPARLQPTSGRFRFSKQGRCAAAPPQRQPFSPGRAPATLPRLFQRLRAGRVLAIFPFLTNFKAMKRRIWTKKELAMLGKISDRMVAERTGLGVDTVSRQRRKLRIPPVKPDSPFKWTKEALALLGTMPDEQLAATFVTTRTIVARKRRKLGIAQIPLSPPATRPLKPAEIKLLGTMTDSRLADQLDVPLHRVFELRRQLGIPSYRTKFHLPKPQEALTFDEINILGTMTDASAAEKLGVSHATARKARIACGIAPLYGPWSAQKLALLGKVPDRVLAAELGISHQAVAQQRQRQNIPPYQNPEPLNTQSPLYATVKSLLK